MPSCPEVKMKSPALAVCMPVRDGDRFRMYYQNYGHHADARDLYASLPEPRRVSACADSACHVVFPVFGNGPSRWPQRFHCGVTPCDGNSPLLLLL